MITHFERLAKSLSASYKVRSTLGSGGAAHVYVADEVATGRRVAIKVLREEQASTISAARFLAEIEAGHVGRNWHGTLSRRNAPPATPP